MHLGKELTFNILSVNFWEFDGEKILKIFLDDFLIYYQMI